MVTFRLLQRLFLLLIGFCIGAFFSSTIFKLTKTHLEPKRISEYNETLARNLSEEVKILCMVITNPKNHKTKAVHVKNTWGKRCNKLLFITSETDPELDTFIVRVNESRKVLRRKVKEAFLHAYDKYHDEFDWFMKADDDSFVIMENLRHLLYQYRPQTSLLFGHRQIYQFTNLYEGYMAGTSYILSKKALEKLSKTLRENPKKFFYPDDQREDVEMGAALENKAIFVDCRDAQHQLRIFPIPLYRYFLNKPPPWYLQMTYYNFSSWGSMKCCSDVPITFHYVKPKVLYFYEYLTYRVHPFGIDSKKTTLPRKLSLDEIIAGSDVNSHSIYFRSHKDFHEIESSEFY